MQSFALAVRSAMQSHCFHYKWYNLSCKRQAFYKLCHGRKHLHSLYPPQVGVLLGTSDIEIIGFCQKKYIEWTFCQDFHQNAEMPVQKNRIKYNVFVHRSKKEHVISSGYLLAHPPECYNSSLKQDELWQMPYSLCFLISESSYHKDDLSPCDPSNHYILLFCFSN